MGWTSKQETPRNLLCIVHPLRDQGLPVNQLNIVFESLIVSRIRCAIPAWGGFVTAELRGTINAVFLIAFRYGFCNKLLSVEQIMEVADCRFFYSNSTTRTLCQLYLAQCEGMLCRS